MDSPKSFIEHFRLEHYGIDQFGNQRADFGKISRQLKNAIAELSKGLYEKENHFIFELLQNAEDNDYESASPELKFKLLDQDPTGTPNADGCLCVFNNETGFTQANVESISQIATSTKTKLAGYIGEKGIGFKSVFLVSERPHIFSNGFHFRFAENDPNIELAYIVPYWVESLPDIVRENAESTCILLPLKPERKEQIAHELSGIAPETILFLSKLQGISLDIATGGRTELIRDHRVENETDLLVTNPDGETTSSSYALWRQEFDVPDQLDEEKREGVEDRVVSIAFPLASVESTGRIFAYLPTEVRSGLPFLANADFLLSSSRESIQTDRAWNAWVRDCIAETVIEGITWLASTEKHKHVALSFAPLQSEITAIPEFLHPLCATVLNELSEMPVVLTDEETLAVPSDARIVTQRVRDIFPQDDRPSSFFAEKSFCHSKLKCSSKKLMAVGVTQFDVTDLRECLEDEEWLKRRDIEWFTSFLAHCSTLAKSKTKWLLKKPIIPTSDGRLVSPTDPIFYLANSSQRERIQDAVSSAGAPSVSFIDESLYEQLAKDPTIKTWLDEYIGVTPYSASSHIAEAIVPWADQNVADLTSATLFRLHQLILSSWSELDSVTRSVIRSKLPIALDDKTVVARPSVENTELIVPRTFNKENGWQQFLLASEDYQHMSVLADAYMTLKEYGDSFGEFFDCLDVEQHPDLEEHQFQYSGEKPERYAPYLADEFEKAQRPWSNPPRIHSWMPPTFLFDKNLRENGRHRRPFIHWLEKMLECRPDEIAYGSLKWFYYSSQQKKIPSGLFWHLSCTPWVKTTKGFRTPAETFKPSKSVKEILGNSVPYLEDKMSDELCSCLGIQVEATTDAIIAYLAAQAGTAEPDLTTIKRLYQHLNQYGKELEESFATLPLAYIPSSDKLWYRSGEVVWQDLSDVFGDVYVGLSPTYGDDNLRSFFVKKLGVSESIGAEELANAWLRLVDDDEPDSSSVENALEKVMPMVLRQISAEDELPNWWRKFASNVQVWTLDRIFHEPGSTFAGDDDFLRRKLEDHLYFIWKPPSRSHNEMRPLYDQLGIRPISEALTIRLASTVEEEDRSELLALTSWSKRLLSYLVFSESADDFDDQVEAGPLRSVLMADEFQVNDMAVVYEIEDEGLDVTDNERVAFFDVTGSALILRSKIDRDALFDEVAESLSRALWGRNWRKLNDSVRAILGIGNEPRYRAQKDRRGWHMPKPKMRLVDGLIDHEVVRLPKEGDRPEEVTDQEPVDQGQEQEKDGQASTRSYDEASSSPDQTDSRRDSTQPAHASNQRGQQREKTASSQSESNGRRTVTPFKGRSRSQSVNKNIERSRQTKIATYVVGEDTKARRNDPAYAEKTRRDRELGNKAEQYVVELEHESGRDAQQMSVNYPGYDIKSTDTDTGEVRFIEVKATRSAWGERGVGLSATQYNKARERRLAYWLYVVEFADSDKPKVTRIQNPAEKATAYLFDKGWKVLAAPDHTESDSQDSEPTDEIEELKSLTDDENCRRIIDLCEKHDLVYPDVGYDLMTEDEVVVAEAELAWPRSAVAVFLESQLEDNDEFLSRGWTTFVGDVTRDDLIAAILGDQSHNISGNS